jgi:hypothetical protein
MVPSGAIRVLSISVTCFSLPGDYLSVVSFAYGARIQRLLQLIAIQRILPAANHNSSNCITDKIGDCAALGHKPIHTQNQSDAC